MTYINPGVVMAICVALLTAEAPEEPHLRVHFFPVGEGDATVIECNDMKGNVSLTLVNAGSVSLQRDKIQVEYFKFLESMLNKPNYYLKNIILTNSDTKFYNFIESLVLLNKGELLKLHFYLGGQRISYVILDAIFKKYDNVFEFTRENEIRGKVSSCGHFSENKTFLNCLKRDDLGPIENSDEIIHACEGFQISVVAANYGFSHDDDDDLSPNANQKAKNSLLLKVTPSGQPTPSILIGDFENDEYEDISTDSYYTFIKEAHTYYTESQTSSLLPSTLSKGLGSTVIKLPENGANTAATTDFNFYSHFVQPTYCIISSDITDTRGHPHCDVVETVNKYLSEVSQEQKTYQCHPGKARHSESIIIGVGSDHLYQTTLLDLSDVVHGKILHNLITLTMTTSEINKPITRVLYHIERFK